MTRMRSLVRIQYLPPFSLPFEVCLAIKGNCHRWNLDQGTDNRMWFKEFEFRFSSLSPVIVKAQWRIPWIPRKPIRQRVLAPFSDEPIGRIPPTDQKVVNVWKITLKTVFSSKLFCLTHYWISNPEVIRFVASQRKSTLIIGYKKEGEALVSLCALHMNW